MHFDKVNLVANIFGQLRTPSADIVMVEFPQGYH
jgi:hypothetical protein